MKILFVCSGDNEFGIAPFIQSQADSLLEKGIQVDLFLIKGNGLWKYLFNAFRLREYLNVNPHDIIHAHYSLCGWASVLSFSKIPIVLSLMGSDTYGTYSNKNSKSIIDYFLIYSTKLLLYFVDMIIVKSMSLYSQINKKQLSKTYIVPNGVDFNKFYPIDKTTARQQLNLKNDINYILFLGNYKISRKNYSLASEVSTILKRRNYKIELLAPFPVDPNVINLYLNASDLLLLTSFAEGSPNVIKEALACNIPVISTDVGDVKEHIEKLTGSYIVPFEHEVIIDKILKILKNSRIHEYRNSIEHLKNDQIATKLIQLYSFIIKK